MVNVFAVPVIIVSILLSFLKQNIGPDKDPAVYRRLRKQVWVGTLLGLLICIVVGCGLIGAFYGLGKDAWSGAEYVWEGVFGLIASIIITVMGAALLRVSKLQAKWRVKLAAALEAKDGPKGKASTRFKRWLEKYAMFVLPFITVLREGLEAVVFIGGVSLGLPASSIPLATVVGLGAGCLVGVLIYKFGNLAPLQYFLIVSTCVLYLVAAGLFSRAIWYFEQNAFNNLTGGDAAETGSGAGSYDIRVSVWHVNCCNPELNGGSGWGIFNAILGWQNSATLGSVIGYNLYWVVVISAFICMRYNEKKGHWPFLPSKGKKNKAISNPDSESQNSGATGEKSPVVNQSVATKTIQG
ncbi:putative plasma membrane iron permease [Phaeomoniella chlamydospora]|uniref:Putative plasma membrane iron permease n=1 Tax=Phaeomoniella chlamydospora TaxID=158046 RepID=A0A0G2ECC8_PHACM|nr:putative plasma membrane iron permease [Phaeomoniella chlamydospora]